MIQQTFKQFEKQPRKIKAEHDFVKWIANQNNPNVGSIAHIREDILCDDGLNRYGNLSKEEIERALSVKDWQFNPISSGYKSLLYLLTNATPEYRNKVFPIIEKRAGDAIFLWKNHEVLVEVKHSYDFVGGVWQCGLEFENYSAESYVGDKRNLYESSPHRYFAVYPESKTDCSDEFILAHKFSVAKYLKKMSNNWTVYKVNAKGYKYIPFPIDLLYTRDFSIHNMKQFEQSIENDMLRWKLYKGRK
jgi:hypothetical protein